MKSQSIIFTLLLALTPAVQAEAISDPEAWYRSAYAPLWADQPAKQIEKMLAFYAPTVETHAADGGISRDDRRTWLAEPIAGWVADGWLKSELKELKVDKINTSTVAFKASWVDYYKSAPKELSCGWYLADWSDDHWQ